ncbi:hypothetical protein DMENIID0001_040350 [Sergentomyia squamirostris]
MAATETHVCDFSKILAKELREYIKIQREVLVRGDLLLIKEKLNDNEIKKILHVVANHLILNRSNPRKPDYINWAEAICKIFPCMKVDSQVSFEAVYNPKTRSGLLVNIVSRILRRKKFEERFFEDPSANQNPSTDDNCDPCSDDDDEVLRMKEELMCLFGRKNRQKIVAYMDKTFLLRKKFLATPEKANILIEYPRFCDTHGLVQLDFKKLYPDSYNNLKEGQEAYSEELQKKLHIHGKISALKGQNSEWDPEIVAALKWITLLPPTGNGRGNQKRPKLDQAFLDFIIFSSENEDFQSQDYPVILAQGSSRRRIEKFYVAFDGRRIVTDNSFLDAFDILFKVFFIFDINFPDSLSNFYTYVAYYIFHIRDIRNRKQINTTINKCRLTLSGPVNDE